MIFLKKFHKKFYIFNFIKIDNIYLKVIYV